jgi:hypothetical protein
MYETIQITLNDDVIKSLKTCEIVKTHVSLLNKI